MRVLVVDDSPDVCWAHEKLLRILGHDALGVQDGVTAIAEAKRFQPDVIVLDICMPGMDGWQVAEQLRADPQTSRLRLVAVTAMMGPECEQRSRDAGFDAHFAKPIRLTQWAGILSV